LTEIIALDVGGTHARFARARVNDGTITVGEPVTLRTSDYASLQTAWEEFARRADGPVPRAASIAIAAPIVGDTIRMTNNSWIFRTDAVDEQLGLDAVTLINDFGAVAHAVCRLA
jgi:glucokinase